VKVDASRLKRVELIAQTDEVIVVNKPCGMAVHGGAGQTGRTLIDILKEASEPPGPIFPVHRLDRATSGLVVFAKSALKAKALGAIWPKIQKTYWALVFGAFSGPTEIRSDIEGKSAISQVLHSVRIEHQASYSLLQIRLQTGRTHQIRRHMQMLGHCIVMDDKYGDFAANKVFRQSLKKLGCVVPKRGLFLHAYEVDLLDSAELCRVQPPAIWFQVLSSLGHTDVDLLLNPKVV
jgi:23S rRNA-/tRNA-specific pseudouridylate synthase